ncbi:pregnancy-associated plasma protein-A-domain-containing protein [Crepidotus variabilis]|uniref:Pregnancy-associated plasma protein-A-domain-containing protein n=1 Tax=Crepidotus variabilis TaxID=179855 RepID=A0A9P6EB91_9AGAR|nr:pregnancy-associated plasma protein-A-domain-containing protein [Crepidotus variabilis]
MIKELREKSPITKRQDGQQYNFGVYFNIVASNLTEAGGYVPQKQIDDQMTLLNTKYVGTGISFKLLSVTRVVSRYWHETIDSGFYRPQTDAMYSLFHKGSSTTMNVYSVGFYDAGLNGYSTLPASYKSSPKRDGVVLLYATLPGGTSKDRQGGTLVHEAGHWLGLRHTFQGGCTGAGDGVDDTPPSAEANFDCPIGLDSCPGDNFPDPIHNYMDYTDETCRTEFTPGQIDLMHKSVATWRSDPSV